MGWCHVRAAEEATVLYYAPVIWQWRILLEMSRGYVSWNICLFLIICSSMPIPALTPSMINT
jgi:hypothetical protein